MSKGIHLVLGGARSGKSRFAEQLASNSGQEVIYIATATVYDDEMQERINRHIYDRPKHWQTVEEPIQLAKVLKHKAKPEACILVDCLTLWLTNLLMTEQNQNTDESQGLQSFAEFKAELLQTLPTLPGQVVLVSNEVGQGVVPLGELSRRFVDEAGWLHQEIAALADEVSFITAGIAQKLK
jgi:adenosylcobinamide kinase/adenosylcobinamide-phosphate guanylyltransferase